ncbi:MAG TPA: Gfo/Idh/MocA family oxidoreductase, partial [Bryobacteraceae bacterium]|nr:Gfo/Idh/MocA family oxidoreductase [Bryobacteraceae bacterium]
MNVAVAGLGFMGATHLKAWRQIPAARLVAVQSSDEAKLAGDLTSISGNLGSGGEKMDFSGIRKYGAVGALLQDPDIDAIDLCVPTDQHAPLAIAALRAGKHVFLEKPMALDPSGADAVRRAAEESGRVLMVGHVLRFSPAYRRASKGLG